MRLYDRGSRTADYAGLDHTLRAAIEQHAHERLLGAVTPVACVETRSVSLQPHSAGFLGRLAGMTGEAEHRTVGVLLPHALIVATTGAERGIIVKSTRLVDISAISRQNPAHVIDPSIMIEGRWGSTDVSSYLLALGDDPAGQGFHETLRAAVIALRQRI